MFPTSLFNYFLFCLNLSVTNFCNFVYATTFLQQYLRNIPFCIELSTVTFPQSPFRNYLSQLTFQNCGLRTITFLQIDFHIYLSSNTFLQSSFQNYILQLTFQNYGLWKITFPQLPFAVTFPQLSFRNCLSTITFLRLPFHNSIFTIVFPQRPFHNCGLQVCILNFLKIVSVIRLLQLVDCRLQFTSALQIADCGLLLHCRLRIVGLHFDFSRNCFRNSSSARLLPQFADCKFLPHCGLQIAGMRFDFSRNCFHNSLSAKLLPQFADCGSSFYKFSKVTFANLFLQHCEPLIALRIHLVY